MAEASSSRTEPKTLREDVDSSDEGRTRSYSSGGKTKRDEHWAQQRQGRRSRPTSGTSQISAKRASVPAKQRDYNEPDNYENLNEAATSPPVENTDENSEYVHQSYLEDARGKVPSSPAKARNPRDPRRRYSGRQNSLSEVAAPAPVQNREQGSEPFQEDYLEDADRAPSEDSATPPPVGQTKASDYLPKKPGSRRASRFATELYTVSYLIFFSILGTLARLGVQWLTFYPGAPVVTPVLWANFAGSLFMGFLAEDRRLFRDEWGDITDDEQRRKREQDIEKDPEAFAKNHAKTKKTIPLFIGLATGFCGSLTSFSSFQRDIFLALSNDLPTPVNHPYTGAGPISATSTVHRNGGYSFMALVAIIVLTLALCLSALKVGAHIALLSGPIMPTIPFRFARKILDRLMVILAFGCWLGAIFLAIWPPDRPGGPSSRGSWSNETWRGEATFALVFAPLGCLLRFYASMKLNGLVPAFPLGTFAVNMLGTAIEGMCYDIQHVGVGVAGMAGGGFVGCQVLQGVMDGFCGCLTTVSTWVAELQGLRRRHAYSYGMGSTIGGLCLMVVVMGSVRWSVGWTEPVCNTGTHTFPS